MIIIVIAMLLASFVFIKAQNSHYEYMSAGMSSCAGDCQYMSSNHLCLNYRVDYNNSLNTSLCKCVIVMCLR